MTRLSECFIETFGPLMQEHGFSLRGRVFHRLCNEQIVQLVTTHTYSGGQEFTIQMAIFPLCEGHSLKGPVDGTRLDEIILPEDRESECDGLFPTDDDGLEQEFVAALKLFFRHMLPILQGACDYQSLWNVMSTCRVPCFGNLKYRFDLKLAGGYYQLAIDEWEEILKEKLAYNLVAQLAYRAERNQKWCEELERVKEMVAAGDFDGIKAFLREKEQYSLASYKRSYRA